MGEAILMACFWGLSCFAYIGIHSRDLPNNGSTLDTTSLSSYQRFGMYTVYGVRTALTASTDAKS